MPRPSLAEAFGNRKCPTFAFHGAPKWRKTTPRRWAGSAALWSADELRLAAGCGGETPALQMRHHRVSPGVHQGLQFRIGHVELGSAISLHGKAADFRGVLAHLV